MSLSGKAFIACICEHSIRRADGISTVRLHAEVALQDAELTLYDLCGTEMGAIRDRLRAMADAYCAFFRPAPLLEQMSPNCARFCA